MKPGITSKLFFVILTCCIVVALAMAAGIRYSADKGFLGYINEQEALRVSSLRPILANAYQDHGGNWDFLRDRPHLWFTLLAPPGMSDRDNIPGASAVTAESDLIGLNLRVTLLDAQRRMVIGNPRTAAASYNPIEAKGQTIGWIALVPFQEVSTGAGRRFQEQQTKANWLIAAIAVMLAALAAWLLARMVLAPVKRLAAASRRLATGDYGGRVVVHSKDELGVLAEDFNRLARTLEKNERLRRAFMADVSHELRTPLSVLQGELEALEDGIRVVSPAALQSLQGEVRTLGKLVDDLYELSLSDAGALAYRKQRIDALAVLGQALALFAARYDERAIRLLVDSGPAQAAWCDADPDRLRQLYTNLLENSLRYTDRGGQLVLRAAVDHGAGVLRLLFEDSAPGVPAAMLTQVFERFFRAEASRSRSTGGAGLGLAICRNIVDAHHGDITAHASPLGGLGIALTLPLARGEQA